jgi:ABC-type polysaccharide/polyol phosphate transport system ATPase subunit
MNNAIIEVNAASLSIPVYGVESQSLKKTLISMTSAGRIATNAVSGLTQVEALVDVTLAVRPGDRIGTARASRRCSG